MSIYDITGYGIRVMLDGGYYDPPSPDCPTQVEGTVLQLMTHGRTGEEMYNNGQIIDLLCDYSYEGAVDAFVRWDNDIKNWFVGGTMILRSAKFGRIKSIWPGTGSIAVDDRPFHKLCPRTHQPQIPSIFHTHNKNQQQFVFTGGGMKGVVAKPTMTYIDVPAEGKLRIHTTPKPHPVDEIIDKFETDVSEPGHTNLQWGYHDTQPAPQSNIDLSDEPDIPY